MASSRFRFSNPLVKCKVDLKTCAHSSLLVFELSSPLRIDPVYTRLLHSQKRPFKSVHSRLERNLFCKNELESCPHSEFILVVHNLERTGCAAAPRSTVRLLVRFTVPFGRTPKSARLHIFCANARAYTLTWFKITRPQKESVYPGRLYTTITKDTGKFAFYRVFFSNLIFFKKER